MSTSTVLEPISALNKEDLDVLKEEIKNDTATPIILRKVITELFKDESR